MRWRFYSVRKSLEFNKMDESLEGDIQSSVPSASVSCDDEDLSRLNSQSRGIIADVARQTGSSGVQDYEALVEKNSKTTTLEETAHLLSAEEMVGSKADIHMENQAQPTSLCKEGTGIIDTGGLDTHESLNELQTKQSQGGLDNEETNPLSNNEANPDSVTGSQENTSFVYENEEPMDDSEHVDSFTGVKYNFSNCVPQRLTLARAEFQSVSCNFLKGCKWSPDGSCLLTNSDDNNLRLFNLPAELYCGTSFDILPEMSSVLQMSEGETVYDYCWYPFMNSSQPDTCCLLSSSRDHPLHLWDAFTGKLRCSYRPYNHMDEIVAATSVSFNTDGSRIFCGFNKTIKIFDTNRPGRDCITKHTVVKKKGGQSGIISAIAFSPESAIYALGSFSKTIGVYDESTYQMMCLLQGHVGGVTHVMFSPDGLRLFSGARKDDEILCWDLRSPGSILYRLLRHVDTNQRIYFDMDSSGQYVVSGSQNGIISVWDTYSTVESALDADRSTLLPTLQFKAHDDCVNGVSFHPSLPLLASASGQRKFPLPGVPDSDEDEGVDTTEEDPELREENSVHLWSLAG